MKYTTPQTISLLDALVSMYPTSSKTTLRSWVKEGRVLVDSLPIFVSTEMLAQGQSVEVSSKKKYLPSGLSILYEDRDIVVVDKPSGLLSVASNFEKELTVHALLKDYYYPRRVQVVHRLDQDTSGVLVFALNDYAYDGLKKTFERHEIDRVYTAIVEGIFESSSGTWKSMLFEDNQYKVHPTTEDDSEGREAITHYKVLSRSKRYSWLELKLETGRKNQIRVHCQAAGHPVVGDKKYGARSNPIRRLCLHAQLLAFEHPVSKKKLRFESPIPSIFFKLLNPY